MSRIEHTVVRTEDATRRRPVLVDIWQPAFEGGVRPTVVLSHGAFGAPSNYAWLAEHLARHGYVVAGVAHFGESFAYGPDTVDPAAPFRPEQRTQDCSFVIDHLLGTSPFRGAIDPARIGVLGHSSGGATALALVGAVFDPAAMQRYCATDAARFDCGCAYARDAVPLPAPERIGPTSQRDDRVRAVVALDPALGPGHDVASLAGITVPVHIVGAVHNDFLPYAQHAGRYARLIPGATLTRLAAGEGHFVFLNQLDRDVSVHGVPLYRDRPGVHRAGVHARLAGVVLGFFDDQFGVRRPARVLAAG